MKDNRQKNTMTTALQLLSKRQVTVFQLKKRLEQKGFDLENINQTIMKLVEWKYLNDTDYALSYIKAKRVKYSKRRTMFELQNAGIDREQTRVFLDKHYTDEQEYENCLQLARKIWGNEYIKWEKKYQNITKKSFITKRVGGKLLMKGFSLTTVRNVLTNEFSRDI
ncbi:MAG: Regulatory protein RecX [Candidatus Dichloromethanomonas elyunquensis]|nr:MAG: Regulatory protein RecX [Candidatus Dichloromethanomonas elyunquensis]